MSEVQKFGEDEVLFDKGKLVDLDVKVWSGQIGLKAADFGFKDHLDMITLGRKYIISPSRIAKVVSIGQRATNLVRANSFKFPFGSTRYTVDSVLPGLNERFGEIKSDFDEAVDELVNDFSNLKAEAYARLEHSCYKIYHRFKRENGSTYDDFRSQFFARIDAVYPTADAIRGKFDLKMRVFSMSIPKTIAGTVVNKQVTDEYNDILRKFVEDEVVGVMRTKVLELAGKIKETCADKAFVRRDTLESLRRFIDEWYTPLNFVGDVTIEKALNDIRKNWLTSDERIGGDAKEEFTAALDKLTDTVTNSMKSATPDSVTRKFFRNIKVKGQEA